MQASSFFHSLTPPGVPFSGRQLREPKTAVVNNHELSLVTMAFKKDGFEGKMVDDNMIVLRERIRKMKCDGDDDRLPDNWMQWEKEYTYSGGYYSDVYEAVGILQRFLMESRPSVVLGMVVVLALGGGVAGMTVMQWLIHLVSGY